MIDCFYQSTCIFFFSLEWNFKDIEHDAVVGLYMNSSLDLIVTCEITARDMWDRNFPHAFLPWVNHNMTERKISRGFFTWAKSISHSWKCEKQLSMMLKSLILIYREIFQAIKDTVFSQFNHLSTECLFLAIWAFFFCNPAAVIITGDRAANLGHILSTCGLWPRDSFYVCTAKLKA
jgi:hypothetical protein